MKALLIPNDVQIVNRTNAADPGDLISFSKLFLSRWANAPEAISDFASIRRWGALTDKLEAARAGDSVELEDQDHATLKKVVEEDVKKGLPPQILVQLEPMYACVIEAKAPQGEAKAKA